MSDLICKILRWKIVLFWEDITSRIWKVSESKASKLVYSEYFHGLQFSESWFISDRILLQALLDGQLDM